MGGRGRGGRGRGRGMTYEQLGVQKGEVLPERVVGPPETYPPLEFRPVQPTQEKNLAESYLLVVKKEFREHMQNSQYFIHPGVKRPDIERYSDRYQLLASHRGQLKINWSRCPKELGPSSAAAKKRKSLTKKTEAKKAKVKDLNVSEALEALQKKEETQVKEGNEEEGEGEEGKPEGEEIEELEEDDEELDEGTDYVNNYFDNGDSYIDEEDDALEEGGVF